MVALAIIDALIWYGLYKLYKGDRAKGPYPENPLFDADLDALFYGPPFYEPASAHSMWLECPAQLCEVPLSQYRDDMVCKLCDNCIKPKLEEKKILDKMEDLLIKKNFEQWLKNESRRDRTLEDYLWQEGIINPQEVVWCNGAPLIPGDEKDFKKFMEIKNQAYLKGEYNSKPLDEGGTDDLHKAWFMLKGCSDYGAEKLVASGTKPWEFDFDLVG